jgi:hypothetical protein
MTQAVDELMYVSQDDAEDMCRRLAREEGIFAGISAAGACWVAQQIAKPSGKRHHRVFIVCDRGDRYLSTGVFPAFDPRTFRSFAKTGLANELVETGDGWQYVYPRAAGGAESSGRRDRPLSGG